MATPARRRPDPLPSLHAVTQAQPDAFFTVLSAALQTTLGHFLFTVLVHDPERGVMRRIFSTRPDINPTGGTKPITEAPWMKQVLQRGEPYIGSTKDDLKTVFFDHELLWSIGCGSVLNMPAVWSGRVFGSLNLLHEEGHYEDADIPTARLFAQLTLPALLVI